MYDETKKVLYSGGDDGKIISWDANMKAGKEICTLNTPFPKAIVAMDYYDKVNSILVGTSNLVFVTERWRGSHGN